MAPLQEEHTKIKWLPPTRRSDRVRVRRHTCECKATIYELCHSGGLFFIRRTIRGPGRLDVRETERLVWARMQDLWLKLITGAAR